MRSKKPRRRRSLYRRKKPKRPLRPAKSPMEDSAERKQRTQALVEEARQRAENLRWLRSIAGQLRGLKAQKLQRMHEWVSAVGLLDEAIRHGAFSDPSYTLMHAQIQPARIGKDDRLDVQAASSILGAIVEFVYKAMDRPRPPTLHDESVYLLLADAIDLDIKRLEDADHDDWIGQTEAAGMIECSEKTIQRRIDDGTISHREMAAGRQVRRSEVQAKRYLICRSKPRRKKRK